MRKWIAMILIFAMLLALTGCGCEHGTADLTLTDVDPENLTAKRDVTCADCGEALEKRDATTGVAPKNGTLQLSPSQWNACLVSNIKQLGAGQTLYPYPAESADNALLHSVVTMSQMNAVFSYRDADGNVITTDQQDNSYLVHNIRMEAQFTNDNVKEFFMLLMIVLINNNSELDLETANALVTKIMGGERVTDNGYLYGMEIISAQDHTVAVSIIAE